MTPGLALALLLAAPAGAQGRNTYIAVGTATRSGYEELSVVGWGEGCSVAVKYLRYSPEGQGLRGVPDAFRIGTITLAPDAAEQSVRWTLSSEGGRGWSAEDMAAAAARLRDEGRHDRSGTLERLRAGRVADQPGLEALLTSTAVFQSDPPLGGFPERYRFSGVHYSPLVSCGLFDFVDPRSPRDGHRLVLARLPEPGVRRSRARAHVSNALLFYRNEGDLTSAEAELAVASAMDPQYALARYNHALLLSLHGRFNEALESLKAAVKRDGEYAVQARKAPELEALKDDPRLAAVLAAAPPPRERRPPPGAPEKPKPERKNAEPVRRHY
ncbi:tetratricopeptide repeat protein [bacterium]|nr:MAG: tetratricopeptide repeat protein [bacterium]